MSKRRSTKTAGPAGPASARGKTVARFEQLTPRQQAVARLISMGRFNAEIAEELECSIKTVDTHRACALARLGVRNNVELALMAIRQGVVPAPEPDPVPGS